MNDEYFIYLLQSEKTGVWYVGLSSDPKSRLIQHNQGKSKFTKGNLVWLTKKETNGQALIPEKKLKNLSRERTIQFVNNYNVGVASPDFPYH